MARFNAAEEKANAGRVSCGDRFGGRRMPRVRVVAKADTATAAGDQSKTGGALNRTDLTSLDASPESSKTFTWPYPTPCAWASR